MHRVLAVMVLVAVAAACSGDDDESAVATTAPGATTTESPPTTAPTTTVAPTTTPPTTAAPASTAPPSTESPATTTEPPPTTVDPLSDLEVSIQHDLGAGDVVLQEVLADPMSPDAEERLEPYFGGEALEFVLDLLETYRDDGLVLMPNPEVPATVETIDKPVLVPNSEPLSATVRVCQIDSGILTAPVADSDLRFPINDDVIRVVAVVTVELADGIWRMIDGGEGDEEIGETTCESL